MSSDSDFKAYCEGPLYGEKRETLEGAPDPVVAGLGMEVSRSYQ